MQTLGEFIEATRILLQDTMEGSYRYSDRDMAFALNMAFAEAYRLRPDMFLRRTIPNYIGKPLDTKVDIDPGYQSAFTYYMAGNMQLRDEEDTQDSRAGVFLNKFTSQLLGMA